VPTDPDIEQTSPPFRNVLPPNYTPDAIGIEAARARARALGYGRTPMEDRPMIPGGPRQWPRIERMPPLPPHLRGLRQYEEEDVPWWRRIGSAVGEAVSPMGMIGQQGENLRAAGQLPMGILDLITYLGHQFGGPATLGGEEGFFPPRTATESAFRSFPTLGQTYPGGAQSPMSDAEAMAVLATMGLGGVGGAIGRRLGPVGRRPTTGLEDLGNLGIRQPIPMAPDRITPALMPSRRISPTSSLRGRDPVLEKLRKAGGGRPSGYDVNLENLYDELRKKRIPPTSSRIVRRDWFDQPLEVNGWRKTQNIPGDMGAQ
jgi:hypothetical protein